MTLGPPASTTHPSSRSRLIEIQSHHGMQLLPSSMHLSCCVDSMLPRFLSAIVSLNDLEVLSRVLLRGQSTASRCEGSKEEGPAGKRVTPTNADMTEHSYWRGFCWSNHSSEPYLGLNLTAVCDKYPMTLGNLTENKQKNPLMVGRAAMQIFRTPDTPQIMV